MDLFLVEAALLFLFTLFLFGITEASVKLIDKWVGDREWRWYHYLVGFTAAFWTAIGFFVLLCWLAESLGCVEEVVGLCHGKRVVD